MSQRYGFGAVQNILDSDFIKNFERNPFEKFVSGFFGSAIRSSSDPDPDPLNTRIGSIRYKNRIVSVEKSDPDPILEKKSDYYNIYS